MNIVPRRFFLEDLFDDFDDMNVKPVNMKCDIYEKDGNYCIEMDLPGYDKKDIDINFDNKYGHIFALLFVQGRLIHHKQVAYSLVLS